MTVGPSVTLHTILAADATLTALLPGGVHRGIPEITRQLAPSAFDANSELRPCALVKAESENAAGPARLFVGQLVSVWVYAPSDDVVEAALARVYALLHRRYLGGGAWEAEFAGSNWGWREDALACRGGVARYEVTLDRG